VQGAAAAWEQIGRGAAVYEAFVEFDAEVSAVVARATDGSTVRYPVAENVHQNGILHTTRVPATIDDGHATEAADIATRIAAAMDHVGVMTVEFFLAGDRLLVNEIAPRIHNSGHYTAAACSVSQSEQHLRAITGNPLAAPILHTGVVMLNILGDAWARGMPDWAGTLADPRVQLHLYDKKEARPGRKMGHILILDADADEALRTAEAIHARLTTPHAVDVHAPRKGG
jgi:5-(carboxyamino)imidazole ribonucleotide synthase